MKKAFCIVLALVSITVYSQKNKKVVSHAKVKAYNPIDYPADQYNTRIDTASLGPISIQAIHVTSKALTDEDPACKAWLIVKKGTKNTSVLFFNDIINDFGCAGVFFPKKQPNSETGKGFGVSDKLWEHTKNLFIAIKLGDYDGRTILINKDGIANSLPGGEFYISKDGEYLFSNYSSDQNGVSIVDLEKNLVVYSDSTLLQNKLGQWYYQDDNFFAIAQSEGGDTNKLTIATLDLKKNKLVFSTVDKSFPDKDGKLPFYSYYDKPENKGSCKCGKR